jgi:hypothetical protein
MARRRDAQPIHYFCGTESCIGGMQPSIWRAHRPLGLPFARGLLGNGIMILETAAIIDDAPAMPWNSNLRFLGDAYFFPSLACLDYLVRFLRTEIIDCAHLESDCIDGLRTARVALSRDCKSIDLYKYCTRVKHQHVSERDTQLWLEDSS